MTESSSREAPLPVPSRHRRWADKFRDAGRGLWLGVQGQSSFAVHLFFAALAVLTAALLGCSLVEWCLVVGCIGLVFTAELFNTALETLFRGLEPAARERVFHSLDIAAAGVLIASLTSAIVGGIVFAPKLQVLFGSRPG